MSVASGPRDFIADRRLWGREQSSERCETSYRQRIASSRSQSNAAPVRTWRLGTHPDDYRMSSSMPARMSLTI
jgi:hypothetical protein